MSAAAGTVHFRTIKAELSPDRRPPGHGAPNDGRNQGNYMGNSCKYVPDLTGCPWLDSGQFMQCFVSTVPSIGMYYDSTRTALLWGKISDFWPEDTLK